MYSSVTNQLYQIGHYLFAFWLLLILVPRLIFPSVYSDRSEQIVSNMMRITALYIVLGYVLVVTKLFEVLAIIGILAFLIVWAYVAPKKTEGADAFTVIGARFYDLIEAAFRLKLGWKYFQGRKVFTDKRLFVRKGSASGVVSACLLIAVMAMSGYIRWYDAWKNAAPSMSDGAVILAWMKYIIRRELFYDGIYPQGQMIMMAYLQKFAQIDPLYVLKYTGGLSTWLIGLGLYFTVSRFTSGRLAAIAAAGAYGLAGTALHGSDWVRQAATLPQEFALLFLLPTLYFFFRYFEKGQRRDLWTAAAGCAVTGLSHFIAFAYAGLGLGILMIIALFQGKEGRRRFWTGAVTGIGCVVVAFIPIGYGRMFSGGLHSSSANFLAARAVFTPPPLNVWDYAGLFCLFIVALAGCIAPRGKRMVNVFVFLFGSASFLIYAYGGTLTQNVVMQTRSESAWTIATSLALGMAWYAIANALLRMKGNARIWTESMLCVGFIVFLAFQIRLKPIIPYKMMWNSSAEQYLEMSKENYRNTWIVFSQSEGYSLALGNGNHQYISTLMKDYDPRAFPLTRRDETKPDVNVSYHIYIVEEKQVYRQDPNSDLYSLLEPEYERRESEYRELRKWLADYQDFNKDLKIFYEDPYIKVYYIYRGAAEESQAEVVWGKPILSDLLKEITK